MISSDFPLIFLAATVCAHKRKPHNRLYQRVRACTAGDGCVVLSIGIGGTAHPVAGVLRNENSLASFVKISGAWNGSVTLFCSAEAAQQSAAELFAAKPSEVTIEQMQDAVGELTNVIGGNLKALAPQPVRLSLPTLVTNEESPRGMGPNGSFLDMEFGCDNHPFRVSILESSREESHGGPSLPTEALASLSESGPRTSL